MKIGSTIAYRRPDRHRCDKSLVRSSAAMDTIAKSYRQAAVKRDSGSGDASESGQRSQ